MKLVFKTLLLLLQIIQNNHLHLELVILNDWTNELVNLMKYDPIDNNYIQRFNTVLPELSFTNANAESCLQKGLFIFDAFEKAGKLSI